MIEVEMVRLKAPPGTDEANYGEHRYKVHDDGTILVPREIAASFEGVAGFVEADAPTERALSGDTIGIRGADAGSTASWRGTTYGPDERGVITVPIEAFADLRSHGFVVA